MARAVARLLTVVAAQVRPVPFDPASTLEKFEHEVHTFPEMARSIAVPGADVILYPTLTTSPDREKELVLARANAIVNRAT